MKHLCIINPMARYVSGHIKELEDEIQKFFAAYPRVNYNIHVTRWKRDASGYTLRYVTNASEMVRVYAFGGTGTLFEVLNGVAGLPNVQVAWYPLGRNNTLLSVFGEDKLYSFQSLKNLSLSPVRAIDTILAGNHYVATNVQIGIEAVSYRTGKRLSKKLMLPKNICYLAAGFYYCFSKTEIRHYHIETEFVELEDDFMGILVSNISNSAVGKPAPEARFTSGFMDIYTIKPMPRRKILSIIRDYENGLYTKWSAYISHYRCKKLRISSSTDMTISMDGELFYDTELFFKICPASLNFVCPPKVDESDLFNRPDEKTPPENTLLSKEFDMQEVSISEVFP